MRPPLSSEFKHSNFVVHPRGVAAPLSPRVHQLADAAVGIPVAQYDAETRCCCAATGVALQAASGRPPPTLIEARWNTQLNGIGIPTRVTGKPEVAGPCGLGADGRHHVRWSWWGLV